MSNQLHNLQRRWRYLLSHSGFRRAPLATVSRLIWRQACCQLGISAIVNLCSWESRLYLPPNGAGTMMIYAVRELYEKELVHLGKFISPGMVVVDAGANCGIYTVAAARLVGPTGRVFSFEPGMQSFSALQKNVQLNHLQNVTTFRAALADREGIARLYHAGRGPISFTLAPPVQDPAKWEEVVTRALQNVLQEEKAEQVGLIKLDVEGAEELVLQGAKPVIVRHHPIIIFEVNSGTARDLGLSPVGAWNLLDHFGYRFFSLTGLGELRELDQPPPENECMNLVAIHHERANEGPNHWPRL